VKLSIGDKAMCIETTIHGSFNIAEVIGVYNGIYTLQFKSEARFGYYPEELAKGFADTKIARKLYENKIAYEQDGLIFIRLEDL
jgi:hypothetical protein